MPAEVFETWQKAPRHKIYRKGMKMRVYLPGKKQTSEVVFLRHEKRGDLEHLIVRDSAWRERIIYPDAVK